MTNQPCQRAVTGTPSFGNESSEPVKTAHSSQVHLSVSRLAGNAQRHRFPSHGVRVALPGVRPRLKPLVCTYRTILEVEIRPLLAPFLRVRLALNLADGGVHRLRDVSSRGWQQHTPYAFSRPLLARREQKHPDSDSMPVRDANTAPGKKRQIHPRPGSIEQGMSLPT
jgi:hypothetical protein